MKAPPYSLFKDRQRAQKPLNTYSGVKEQNITQRKKALLLPILPFNACEVS
jgi:hypothetical protein